MRMGFHDLVGRHVFTSDGRNVGRIANLRAEPIDGKLRVTYLLVGPRALAERIAGRIPAREIGWDLVRRVGDRVELRVTLAELATSSRIVDG